MIPAPTPYCFRRQHNYPPPTIVDLLLQEQGRPISNFNTFLLGSIRAPEECRVRVKWVDVWHIPSATLSRNEIRVLFSPSSSLCFLRVQHRLHQKVIHGGSDFEYVPSSLKFQRVSETKPDFSFRTVLSTATGHYLYCYLPARRYLVSILFNGPNC